MATRKKAPAPATTKQKTISSDNPQGRAKMALMPEVNSAIVINAYGKAMGGLEIQDLLQPLDDSIKVMKGGNLVGAEAMLMGQAHALQSIFTELSRRAASNMGEYLNAMETYLRLALKAQSQCTKTIEVLAAIKNPPVVFAKQANIAHGPQQVNNGATTPTPTHAGKTVNQPNELLEDQHATVDNRAAPTASLAHPELEAVGTIDGGENR